MNSLAWQAYKLFVKTSAVLHILIFHSPVVYNEHSHRTGVYHPNEQVTVETPSLVPDCQHIPRPKMVSVHEPVHVLPYPRVEHIHPVHGVIHPVRVPSLLQFETELAGALHLCDHHREGLSLPEPGWQLLYR